jgi:nitrogen-specific signal transduction histidine kinase
MYEDSAYLPVVMAITALMHLSVHELIATYKNTRVVNHFIEQSKAKDDFVRCVTHEIKSPLNGILGCADLLANQENHTPEQAEQVSVIMHSATVLNLLVDNV